MPSAIPTTEILVYLVYYILSRMLNRVACQRDQRTITLRRFLSIVRMNRTILE